MLLSFCTRTAASGIMEKTSFDSLTSSGFQYSGFPAYRMDSSFTYFSKIKGPVPTGLRFMSEGAPDLSKCAAYSAERIDAGGAARFDRKTALGDLSVKRTIYGLNRSGSSIFSTS